MSLERFFNLRSLAIVGASQRKGKVGYEILACTTQIKMTLRYYHSISDFLTQVQTNRGVVTLEGKARNIAEKDLITQTGATR